jgi:hypothetical protein
MKPPDGVWHTGEAGFYGYVFFVNPPTGKEEPTKIHFSIDMVSPVRCSVPATSQLKAGFRYFLAPFFCGFKIDGLPLQE